MMMGDQTMKTFVYSLAVIGLFGAADASAQRMGRSIEDTTIQARGERGRRSMEANRRREREPVTGRLGNGGSVDYASQATREIYDVVRRRLGREGELRLEDIQTAVNDAKVQIINKDGEAGQKGFVALLTSAIGKSAVSQSTAARHTNLTLAQSYIAFLVAAAKDGRLRFEDGEMLVPSVLDVLSVQSWPARAQRLFARIAETAARELSRNPQISAAEAWKRAVAQIDRENPGFAADYKEHCAKPGGFVS